MTDTKLTLDHYGTFIGTQGLTLSTASLVIRTPHKYFFRISWLSLLLTQKFSIDFNRQSRQYTEFKRQVEKNVQIFLLSYSLLQVQVLRGFRKSLALFYVHKKFLYNAIIFYFLEFKIWLKAMHAFTSIDSQWQLWRFTQFSFS